jgi:hypothetical protein
VTQTMKHIALRFLDNFELGDHEFILATFGPWPLRFFVTVWEPRYRRSVARRAFPWRMRCALATVLSKRIYSTCTKCGEPFTLRELLAKDGSLTHFISGSVCHRDCGGTNHLTAYRNWYGKERR